MKQDEIRRKLIDGTIRVLARDGFDKATTKQIGTETAVNEAYIYRCFAGKEDMFAKTFGYLDNLLAEQVFQHMHIMGLTELDFEQRCRRFFYEVWGFMLQSSDNCLAYVHYYYSPYFKKYSYQAHESRFMPLVEIFSQAFIEEADVWMILNHILNVMLDFAVKVHNDLMPKNDGYSEHVFRVVYVSIKQYFKPTQESEA